MDTIGSRIKLARELKKVPRGELAKAAGIGYSTLADLENDYSTTTAALHKIAKRLAVNVDWLETGKGEMEPASTGGLSPAATMTEVPIWHAKAAAGLRQENGDGDPAGSLLFRPKSLAKKGVRQDKAHAFYVSGDSMAPRLRDGDVILFDTADLTIRDGKMFVIRWGDDTLVKRLYRELDGGVRVVSDNPDPAYRDRLVRPDDEGFEIIGRVRWTASWED